MKIKLRNVWKKYEGCQHYALKNVNLTIDKHDFFVILGPTGSGKSTLLRTIAGLNPVSRGDIFFNNIRVNELNPQDRNIAMVFSSKEHPHLTIYKNIALELKVQKKTKFIDDPTIINQHKNQNVNHCAIIKCLPQDMTNASTSQKFLNQPKVFLIDEPLMDLNPSLQKKVLFNTCKVHQILDTTIIFATEKYLEAMTLGSKIALMNRGQIEQIGTPRQLYEKPQNLFVAQFIGQPTMNLWQGQIVGHFFISHSHQIKVPLNSKYMYKIGHYQIKNVTLGIRSEDIQIMTQKIGAHTSGQIKLEQSMLVNHSTIDKIEAQISTNESIVVKVDQKNLAQDILTLLNQKPQKKINFKFKLSKIHLFNTDTSYRI